MPLHLLAGCPWGTGGAGGKGACGAHRLWHGGARGAWGGGLALYYV